MSESRRLAFKKWLKKKGWTIEQFGAETDIGYHLAASLSSKKYDKRKPQPRTIRMIAAVCPDCPLVK